MSNDLLLGTDVASDLFNTVRTRGPPDGSPRLARIHPDAGMKTRQRHRKDRRPSRKVLAEIIERIVEAAQPDRIILFGSAARGEMGPDSDIDLLVIKSGKFNHWRLLTTIYRSLHGDLGAVDVVLASALDIQRYGDSPYLVYYPALREGKVVYGA